MILNKKVVNYKVASLYEIYDFYFGHFSEVIWKIQVSYVRNSSIILLAQMISNIKVVNYKVV
jgi:hypothetical protein